MRRLTIALMTVMATFHSADAGFVNDYTRWQGLDKNDQSAYVLGLVDRILYENFKGEPSFLTAWRQGIESCAFSQHLNGEMIATAVNQQYLTYPADQRVPAAVVFDSVIQAMCIDSINIERAKLGLSAWQAKKGPILAQ